MKKNIEYGIITVCACFFLAGPAFSANIYSRDHSEASLSVSGGGSFFVALSDEDDWPMFLHDPQHTGYTMSAGPETNQVKWCEYAHDSPNQGLAVANGNLYVGSTDWLYCMDTETGDHKWYVSVGNYVNSVPAVADGRVYIGSAVFNQSGNHEWKGRVNCINASTGARIWNFTTGDGIDWSSPAVVNGRVYIGALDHKVYCLNASTGAEQWNYSTGDMVYSSPAVVDGYVFIGSNDGNVYCFNAETGEKIWERSTKAPKDTYSYVKSSPAVVNGRVFIASTNRVYQGGQFLYGYGKVFCLNAANGSVLWEYSNFNPPKLYFGPIVSSPAVLDDRVYIGSYRAYNGHVDPIMGAVYCLDADPSDGIDEGIDDPNHVSYDLIWSHDVGGPVISAPAITAQGNLYIGAIDGFVYCLNATTGDVKWNYELGPLYCSPAVVNNDLYLIDYFGQVYCFGKNQAPEKPRQPSGPTTGLPGVNYTFSTVSTDPEGHQIWYFWDWGDGNWTWSAPHNSGEPVMATHSWAALGTYAIRVFARDIVGKPSAWSEPLQIRVVILGDMNNDGFVDFKDINPFVLALSKPELYENQYGLDPDVVGDIDQDGTLNFGDINPFILLLADG